MRSPLEIGATGARRARSGGLGGAIANARARVHLALGAWTGLLLRAAIAVVALIILAWIGRTAATAQASMVRVEGAAPSAMPSGSSSTAPGMPSATRAASATSRPTSTPAEPSPVAPSSPPIEGPVLAASPSGAPRGRATATDPVYINHAGTEELRRLPGVGPKRAEAILALRQRVGHFQRVEDLLRVKGVGRATLRKWRPLVRLDAPGAKQDGDAGPP